MKTKRPEQILATSGVGGIGQDFLRGVGASGKGLYCFRCHQSDRRNAATHTAVAGGGCDGGVEESAGSQTLHGNMERSDHIGP
jgi:hypothetical protein